MTHEALWALEKHALRTKLAAASAAAGVTERLVMVLVDPTLRLNGRAFADIVERPALDGVFAELETGWLLARRAPSLPAPHAGTILLVIVSVDRIGAPEARVYAAPLAAALAEKSSFSSVDRVRGLR